MAVCVLLTALFVGLYGQYLCTESCVKPVVTPETLMVQFGDPAEVKCSIPNKPDGEFILGWESKMSQPSTNTETSVMWKVDNLVEWEEAGGVRCFFTVKDSQCETYVNLTIYKEPDSVNLSSVSDVWVEGDQTELRCEVKNVGPGCNLSVRWSRADPKQNTFTQFTETFFPELNEMKIVSRTAVLHVTPSREDDGVQYQCTAVLHLHQTLVFPSQPITISVHYKPNIIEPLDSTVTVSEGENLTLTCSAHGNPLPHYCWTLANSTTISNSSTIIIRSIHPEKQGQYTCTAYNHLGNHTKKVRVTVEVKVKESCVKPVVTPETLMVQFGDPAEVKCSIPNKPDGEFILGWESKMSQPSTNTETSVMWKVDNLVEWEEAGGVRCFFTVKDSQCETYVNLTIYKEPDSVNLSSVSDVWVEGDQTELRCEVKNVGPGCNLSVRWSRADPKQNTFTQFTETFFPELNEMKIVSRTAVLHVTPSREDDGVQYQCTAVLHLHQTLVFPSQPITISVHYKPNIIEPLDSTVTVSEGENLTLTCSAHGNPLPHYCWTLANSTTISNSSTIIIRSIHPEKQGQYTCTAYNHLGNHTKKVRVTVEVKVKAGQPPLISVWGVVTLLAVTTML